MDGTLSVQQQAGKASLQEQKRYAQLLQKLAQLQGVGRADPHAVVAVVRELAASGEFPTLEPLLPMLLSLDGQPYTLSEHFAFSPLFTTWLPRRCLYRTGRQVSKSTGIAASSVLRAGCIPYYKQLYITPLYEMARRMSSTRVGPFIDESPIKALWTGTGVERSVLTRSFKNHSRLQFTFALLDIGRTRGLSADALSIDESYRIGTLVTTPTGQTPIQALRRGDPVLTFNEDNQIITSVVANVADHGVRDCYCIRFANGAEVEATSDSYIRTTAGWKRINTVITDAATSAAAARHDAGRRINDNRQSQSEVHQPSRLQAAHLQHSEVPALIRARTYATQEGEELRLREMVKSIRDIDLTGLMAYRGFVHPRREEGRDTDVAGSTDLGGNRLVVPGRRLMPGSPSLQVPHGGVHTSGSATAGRLVTDPRPAGIVADIAEPYSAREAAAQDRTDNRCVIRIDREHSSVPGAVDAVQGQATATGNTRDLPLVQHAVRALRDTAEVQGGRRSALLRKSGVPSQGVSGSEPGVHIATREATGASRQESSAVLRRSGGQSCAQSEVRKGVRREEQGAGCGEEAHEAPGTGCETEVAAVDLPEVRTDGAPRRSRSEDSLLFGLPNHSGPGECTAVCCGEAEIVEVFWTGQHRVFDIEVTGTHAFFAGGVAVTNCQDFDKDFIPIVRECLSHSKWALEQFTGTPKTLDNTLELQWNRSSQAEWWVPCLHCTTNGKPTQNIPSAEYHLLQMIGPYRNDISPERPGTICYKCRQPINPRFGRWVPKYRDRQLSYAGYHVPQIIMPLHYADKVKWAELLAKMQGMAPYAFHNEVLGEGYDTGTKLVSLTELQKAMQLPWKNDPRRPVAKVMERLKAYTMTVLAIDWGGGGEDGVSFTTLALLGTTSKGRIDCLWGRRLHTPNDHLREAAQVYEYWRMFRPTLITHDYTGAGDIRETVLVQAGVPLERLMPIAYVRAAAHNAFTYVAPTVLQSRGHYHADKTRTLLYTTNAIKAGYLRFFEDDEVDTHNPGLIRDFLNLIEEKTPTRMAGDIYIIKASGQDDFAQAVNIGCACIWHSQQSWPNFAQMRVADLTENQLRASGVQGWGQSPGSGILSTP